MMLRTLYSLIFCVLLAGIAAADTKIIRAPGSGVTSISQGGGSCAVDGSGAIDCLPASGQDFTVDPSGGGSINLLGNVLVSTAAGTPTVQFEVKGTSAGISLDRTGGDPFIQFSVSTTKVGQVRGLTGGGTRFTNGTGATEWARFDSAGNYGVGTAAPGGGTITGTRTLSVANGTEPTGAVAGQIVAFSKDSSDGAANATLGLLLEQAVEAVGTFTPSHKIKIWINGTEYWIELDPV